MKILITGGAGFIGSNFIRYWLENNPLDRIINLDRLTYAGNLENLTEFAGRPNYQFVKGDICDRELVFACAKDADLIVNFAAETHVDRSIADSADFVRTNFLGVQTLLEAAKSGNIRFHQISTDEVYGALGSGDLPFTEKTPYDPRSPYSASKAASDHLVRAYWHTHKLLVTISNCSNNYGPYQFPEKIIPLFITNLLTGKKVPVYGDGQQVRDWIHVDDHNRGVEMIIKKGRIGQTYNLGGNNELSNLQLTKMILAIMGRGEEMIEYVQDRLGHDRRYAIDFSKAKNELGWEPAVDFNQGLDKTIKWYENNRQWWQRVKSGEYQNHYSKISAQE